VPPLPLGKVIGLKRTQVCRLPVENRFTSCAAAHGAKPAPVWMAVSLAMTPENALPAGSSASPVLAAN
jgi:hypothetical protein